ncbi:hypothetical protein [Tautonia rosea]|uniref:hypothetical protein n=1 Tax=Tautonia rosea TaxID=2728037 RepID=UPI001472CECD|nr:hypothetical protein [Tautonia rosea]
MADRPRLNAFVVHLTDPENEAEAVSNLREMAAKGGIAKIPLTLMENPDGPPAYRIAEDAEVTILIYRFFDVRAKQVFGPGELTEADIDRVLADLSKVLGE